MFKQFLQYVLERGKIRWIVLLRFVILILLPLSIPGLQSGGAGLIEFVIFFLAFIGTYFAAGFFIRAEMDPNQPVSFKKYFILFVWMIFAGLVALLLLELIGSLFINPELRTSYENYSKDPSKPLPPELARLSLIIPFVIGLLYFLIAPVLIAKADFWKGVVSLPKYLVRSDYIVAAWTPFVVMFVPLLIIHLISGSEGMVTSFFGQFLGLIGFFFFLTLDIVLQYPAFYIVRNEIQSSETPG